MPIEVEDVMMEMVRTMGESYQTLTEKVAALEKNSVSKAEIKEITDLAAQIKKQTEAILEYKISCTKNCTTSLSILSNWDRFWSGLAKGKTIAGLIVLVISALVGFIYTLVKILQYFPKITSWFSSAPH
jgi:hypothetical protein